MSDHVEFEVILHSLQWGTEDPYTVFMDRHQMRFGRSVDRTPAIATRTEESDPVWSGHAPLDALHANHPVIGRLESQGIYPPTYFAGGLEAAWQAWINHELNDQEVQEELQEFAAWVNRSMNARPRTKFWSTKF